MKATNGKVKYETVIEAMKEANITFMDDHKRAILVWYDTLKDADYFSNLQPFQIVNRIPEINLICRKAPLVRILQNTMPCFLNFEKFLPQSYILPLQNGAFLNAVSKHEKKFIIKPDCGSLGQGITIINKEDNYEPNTVLSIAQEYIDSYLLDGFKFDLRVYALVASISPELQIYVYHDGIARFCSEKADSESVYGQITNTAVNRQNNEVDINNCTRTIQDVFNQLTELGIDTDALWQRIENVCILTIISIQNFMTKSSHNKCPSLGLPRCFQILGFDILIDKDLKPWILEVNYRPSLEYDIEAEKQLKIEMLASAMKIAAPFKFIQPIVEQHVGEWNDNSWRSLIQHRPELVKLVKREQYEAARNSLWNKVFPSKGAINSEFERIISALKVLPVKIGSPYRIPDETDPGAKKRLITQCCVRPVIIQPNQKMKSPQKSIRKKKSPLRHLTRPKSKLDNRVECENTESKNNANDSEKTKESIDISLNNVTNNDSTYDKKEEVSCDNKENEMMQSSETNDTLVHEDKLDSDPKVSYV